MDKEKVHSKQLFDGEKIREILFEKYPFGYIPRSEIKDATGGLLNPRTMANRDSNKEKSSIRGSVKIGGKICYSIDKVIEYLESETLHDYED